MSDPKLIRPKQSTVDEDRRQILDRVMVAADFGFMAAYLKRMSPLKVAQAQGSTRPTPVPTGADKKKQKHREKVKAARKARKAGRK